MCVTVSGKLSRLYDSATAAREQALSEYPGSSIEIMDSRQATSSEGMIALAGARAAAEGKKLQEVHEAAEKVRGKVTGIAFLDTLKHVYRSGRVPKFASTIGSKLSIKPVLTIAETVHLTALVRSHKKGIEKLLDIMREKVDSRPVRAAVTHAYALEEALQLKEQVSREFNCVEIWLSEFSPVMGYACGTGTVGLSFYEE